MEVSLRNTGMLIEGVCRWCNGSVITGMDEPLGDTGTLIGGVVKWLIITGVLMSSGSGVDNDFHIVISQRYSGTQFS